jgi:hypothetical protein
LDHNDVIGYFLNKDKNSIEIGKEIRLGWHPFTNPTNKLNLLYIIKNKNKYKKTWGTRPRSNCGSLKIYNCLIKNLLRKTLRKKLNEEKKNAMLEIRFTKSIFQKVSSIFSKDITNISNDVIGLRVHSRHVKFLHC